MTEEKINFIEELARLKRPVWEALSSYLNKNDPPGHYKMVEEYPHRQGKYFRPGLLLLSIEMFGGNKAEGVLSGAAVQASEEWLLIHDDIEDHSEMRRHKPTLNSLYGDELALNAGDALHLIMWHIVGEAVRGLKGEKGWKVYEKLNEALLKATEGQYMELKWIRQNKLNVTEAEYLEMVKRKTSYYSIIAPLQIGAIIAGASEDDVKKIEEWGIPFGYTFQIIDDCLSLDANVPSGKVFGEDIMEGKRTLVLIHLLSSCNETEKEQIEDIYKKDRSRKTARDQKFILRMIKKYKCSEYVKDRAGKYKNQAIRLFNKNTKHLRNTKAKDLIRAGIDFAFTREY
jgi:geranylgeranyl diphosphate synthase, type II